MKIFKTTMLGLCLTLAVGSMQLFAFDHHGGRGWHDNPEKKAEMQAHRLEKLTEKLSLTAAQQAELKAIFEATSSQMQTLHQEMKEKKAAIRAQSDNKVATILTKEQLTKYEQLKAERRERHEKKRIEHDKEQK